ncbi:30S ribosomal protein S13 [Sesbania bispinosa]|nr:30S ribosomal protein S13 [Sesbania bispinosa]
MCQGRKQEPHAQNLLTIANKGEACDVSDFEAEKEAHDREITPKRQLEGISQRQRFQETGSAGGSRHRKRFVTVAECRYKG